jgi:hypothetical protein
MAPTRLYRRKDLDALANPSLRQLLAVWRDKCAGRRFPSRSDISPRDLVQVLPIVTLARVVDDATDFELRIIGHDVVQAYQENFTGRRMSSLSDLVSDSMRQAYHAVVREARPVLLEGWFEPSSQNRCFYREVLLTPLGPADTEIDHVLSAGAFGRDEPVQKALARFFGRLTYEVGAAGLGKSDPEPAPNVIGHSAHGTD